MLKYLCLLFSVTQILCTYLSQLTGMGTPIGEGPTGGITPIVPADEFFAIWAILFPGCVYFAVLQLLPAYRDKPGFVAARPLATASFAATTVWDIAAQFGQPWMTPPLLGFVAATAVVATGALAGRMASGAATWLAAASMAMFAGWVSFATFANVADSLKVYGLLSNSNLELIACSALILFAACTVGAVQRFYLRFWLYLVPPLWGLIGILVRNQFADTAITVSVAIAAAIIFGAIAGGMRKQAPA